MTTTEVAQQERAKWAAFIANTADFIGIASVDGDSESLNPAGRRLLGLSDGQELPPEIVSYLAKSERERFLNEIWPRLHSDGRWEGELSLAHADGGDDVPVSAQVFFIKEESSGQRLGIATVFRDIREQKSAEVRHNDVQNELTHATRLLNVGELTASIAHEVNQPLAAIIANSNACLRWLAQGEPALAEARESAANIARDAERASDVIERVRRLATKAAPARRDIDLNAAIRDVLNLLSNDLGRQQITLRLSMRDGLPKVIGDRVQIQQVMLNLLINAIDAMKENTDGSREISISTGTCADHAAEVVVSDLGAGFDGSLATRMFEPFFTTKPGGLGLGLSITRRIIENHGGRIWVYPNPRRGATFVFTLPCADPVDT